MSIHRNSSSLHIERLHRQQIFKEARQSYHKPKAIQITRQFSRQLSQLMEDKNQMSRCVEDVLQKSYRKIKTDNASLDKLKKKHQPPQGTIKPFPSQLYANNPSLKKLQDKVVKLKNRISPQENQDDKVEMKLHEIMLINNMGHEKKENLKMRKVGRKNDRSIVHLAENEVVNGYWDELSKKAKISKSTLVKIKENRVNMLIRQNADSQQDVSKILEIKERLNQKLRQRREKENRENRKSTDAYTDKSKKILAKFNIRNTNTHSLNNSIEEEEPTTPKPRKRLRHEITKQLVENNFIDYLKNRKERKTFLGDLNKELIEKEDVSKIYTFVKGGYNLDPCDIEGEYISLRRFNQTKESFLTLNEIYKSIKSECDGSQIDEKEGELRQSFDRTLRSIVQLNELNGNIAPNQLLKLMKQRKLVS